MQVLPISPPYQRGKEGEATVVVQPSGGCPGRVRQNSTDNPLALRDRCHIAPPPFVRGNVLIDAARDSSKRCNELKPNFSLTTIVSGYAKNTAKRC